MKGDSVYIADILKIVVPYLFASIPVILHLNVDAVNCQTS